MSAGQEWRDPPPPLRVLAACGWLTEADVRDPRIRVDMTASSHTVFRITTPDGRSVVVKQVPRHAAAAGRSLSRELFVYRLANWIAGVAAAVPAALHIDEAHHVLVLESLGESSSWPPAGPIGSISRPGVAEDLGALMAGWHRAEDLGALMAGWHRATTDTALWPSPAPGILHLTDALPDAIKDRPRQTGLLMESFVADRELSSALVASRDRWRDRCLIHGDIRRENWMTARAGRRKAGLKVLDWELSGSGDPAWDLGSVLAEFVLDTIREPGSETTAWTTAQMPRIRAFLLAYQAHDGLFDPRRADEWDHVVLCGVARLLHVACEWADVQSAFEDSPVTAVVGKARLLLRSRPNLIALLRARRRR